MFATLLREAMKRLRITSASCLLAAMAGLVGACRIDKLLHDPGGGPGTPLRMAFTSQPGDAPAGEPITPAVRVTVQDSTGQPATTFNGPVTVGLDANPTSAALLGTARMNAVNGVATFTDLSVDKAGSGYTLRATTSGATGATSDRFDISAPRPPPPAATHLGFAQQPRTTQAGSAITPAVQVAALDAAGNVVPAFTGPVTIALGANPGSAGLAGTKIVDAVNGVATFSDLSIDKAGTGYTLRATTSGLTGATSDAFDITAPPPPPPPATHLGFSLQPSNTEAGATITPAVEVSALDASGNTVTSFTGTITVAIGANQAGGTLAGTLSVPAANGVATFSNLSINLAGNGYTLTASAAGLTGATSAGFNITAPPPPPQATQLVFTVQPSKTAPGATITPAVEVTAVDDNGTPVTSFTGYVTIAIGHDGSLLGNAVLSGTKMVRAVNGVARFSDLSIDQLGNGYTLQATASGLRSAESSAFNIAVL